MTSEKEQFYIQRIAELEKQVAELLKVNAELADMVAKLSKNSSNSSKPPSSDIVKPAKTKQSDGQCRQGGQLGHKGINRPPFGPDQIDETIPLYADSCDCGYQGHGEPIEEPKVQQTVELLEIWGHHTNFSLLKAWLRNQALTISQLYQNLTRIAFYFFDTSYPPP